MRWLILVMFLGCAPIPVVTTSLNISLPHYIFTYFENNVQVGSADINTNGTVEVNGVVPAPLLNDMEDFVNQAKGQND